LLARRYKACPHPGLSDQGIGFNGLQRRNAQLTLNQPITAQLFRPDPSSTASSLTLTVDLLAKTKPASPVPVDTDAAAAAFKDQFQGQVFSEGQTVAFDFQATKLEVTVSMVETIDEATDTADSPPGPPGTAKLGHVLAPTTVLFSKKGGAALSLSGSAQSGGGGGTIFNKVSDRLL
jgi:hypothetical protein